MVAERLREKAREYELNKLAAEERGESFSASLFAAIAIVLYEVAEAVEADVLDEAA